MLSIFTSLILWFLLFTFIAWIVLVNLVGLGMTWKLIKYLFSGFSFGRKKEPKEPKEIK